MKVLGLKRPTREQLRVISDSNLGVEIIRGAAGSGKTTTALLRLKNLSDMFRARRRRVGDDAPIKVLVLTYNRTLCGYVEALARQQAAIGENLELVIDTYAHWAWEILDEPAIIDYRKPVFRRLAQELDITLPFDFLCEEIEYVLGRFPESDRQMYLAAERTGRGIAPRVERSVREKILELILRYRTHLAREGMLDWELLSDQIMQQESLGFDIAILDEAQDMSANQLRSIRHHLAPVNAMALVIDTAQRLYPRGYTWAEAGIPTDTGSVRFYRLQENHRNTKQIAAFAKGMLAGLRFDDDGTMPNLDTAMEDGPMPILLRGKYSNQLKLAISYLEENVDLTEESVAFLHPKGGGWFSALEAELTNRALEYAVITRQRCWPDDNVNIVLSTMHSAKGLEFDHVIILGLNAEVTTIRDEDENQLETFRRLLAMAVARARKSVIVGYKPQEASVLIEYFQDNTYDEFTV